jgi:DNA-binding FadR family transcriptional regulator
VQHLGRSIVSANPYRPNTVISLSEVMDSVGVSRAMAREVLQILHQKRLVKLQPRVGATVLPVEHWDLFDQDVIRWRLEIAPRFQIRSLTELRQAIEPLAACLAAQRASADVCRDLVSLSQELKLLGMDTTFTRNDEEGHAHRARYSDVDTQFHLATLRGSGNEMFLGLADQITLALRYRIERDWDHTPGAHGTSSPISGTNTRFPARPALITLWLHRGLACAIDQGHPDAAEAFSRAILAEIRTGGLDDPVLRYALQHALQLLDPRGFTDDKEWTTFSNTVTTLVSR